MFDLALPFTQRPELYPLARLENVRSTFLSFGEYPSTGSYYFCQCDLAPKPILLTQVLGDRAYKRLQEIKEAKPGWNFGKGEALSPLAVSSCINLFASIGSFPYPKALRLYLANEGGLNLVWEDTRGYTFMVKCLRDKYVVVIDETNVEETFPLSDAKSVLLLTGLLTVSPA
jgi:hypothetical protein